MCSVFSSLFSASLLRPRIPPTTHLEQPFFLFFSNHHTVCILQWHSVLNPLCALCRILSTYFALMGAMYSPTKKISLQSTTSATHQGNASCQPTLCGWDHHHDHSNRATCRPRSHHWYNNYYNNYYKHKCQYKIGSSWSKHRPRPFRGPDDDDTQRQAINRRRCDCYHVSPPGHRPQCLP